MKMNLCWDGIFVLCKDLYGEKIQIRSSNFETIKERAKKLIDESKYDELHVLIEIYNDKKKKYDFHRTGISYSNK